LLTSSRYELLIVSRVRRDGRPTIQIVDAHRDGGQRFIVRADDKLTAFLELQGSDSDCAEFEQSNHH
jgi:hypothetical protein